MSKKDGLLEIRRLYKDMYEKTKHYDALLATLLFVLGCIGMPMNILVLSYISYIKSSAIFLAGAIGFALIFPLFIIVAHDVCKSIKNRKSSTDRLGYTLILISECAIIYTSIIFFVEYV